MLQLSNESRINSTQPEIPLANAKKIKKKKKKQAERDSPHSRNAAGESATVQAFGKPEKGVFVPGKTYRNWKIQA